MCLTRYSPPPNMIKPTKEPRLSRADQGKPSACAAQSSLNGHHRFGLPVSLLPGRMIFQYIELYGTNRLSRESDSLSGFQLRSLPTANAKTQPLVLITSAQHSAIYRLPLLRYM